MKKYILNIILLICLIHPGISIAARIKYKDVYKIILQGNKDNSYTILLAYQRQNPDFANTYFQLGMIAKEWAKSYNPYREFELTKKFIYDTKLYFDLAKLYMKEEKNRNREYYENAPIIPKGKKLQIEDINAYIDSQLEDIKDYEKNIVKIITYYNKSSDFYNRCVSTFMNINKEYVKIKNIYLSDNEQLLSKMNGLSTDFDSTLINFKLYKAALSKFPLKGYNQNYELKDIITYRLDGLTFSDFLNNKFYLWNYKKWVHEVLQTKETFIKNNHQEISRFDTFIKDKIKTVETGAYSDNFKPYKTDKKLIYKIEKFDNNSLLTKLFKLNEAKLNLLTFFKRDINNPLSLTKYPILKHAEYCNEFIEKKQESDSINKFFVNAIKPTDIKKYNNFYMSKYGGIDGLKKYSLRQELLFASKQKEALQNLKNHLYYTAYEIKTDTLRYEEKLISNKIVPLKEHDLASENYYITDFTYSKEKHLWITGYYISEDNTRKGFTAYSKDGKNIDFVDTAKENDTYNFINTSFGGGCWAIQTTINESIKNILIKYNLKGEKVFSKELEYKKIPRLLKYDDINNNLIIVFNGTKPTRIPDDTEQIIYHYNPDDQLQTYEIKTEAKAMVFDLVKVNNKLLLFSNFVHYKDLNGKTVYSEAGNANTNILVSIISKGIVKKHIPYFNKQVFFGVKSLKINDNTIDILGYKNETVTEDFERLKQKDFYFQVIDSDAKILHSAWNK